MNRFFNSFQVQLYGALVLLTILLVASLYVNNQTISSLAALEEVEQDLRGSQLSNVYLLASLARRYANATEEDVITSLKNSVEITLANSQETQTGLLTGDSEEGIPALTDAIMRPLVEDANEQWLRYEALIESLITQVDTGEIANIEDLLGQIDRQSVIVYTFTQHVVDGLDFGLDQQREFAGQVNFAVGLITLVFLLVAVFVVARSVQAVARLSNIAQEFAKGNLDSRADTKTFSEIADVGSVLNNMAERLGATIHELENKAKEAQEARLKAERSDEVKSAFLASMSHELRTPLNSIINFSKFVVRGMMGPVTERQEETLNKVVASGQHLLSLINDVLDMSKIESGSLNLFVEDDVDMKAIVDTVITNSQSLLNEKSVSLSANLPENLPLLRGDKKRLTQIMFNLVSNACKFTEEGSVLVTVESKDKEILIAVKDTGPGIAEEDRAAVFEAFKQTRSGLRSGEGTGLGMPISKSLVEAHGGRLWFDSVVGEGTSFYVSLPIKSEQLVPVKL